MRAARTGRACTHCEATRQFGLPGSSECRAFLVADANPFDLAAATNGVAERIERVADQAEDLPNANLFEGADHHIRNCPGHLSLLCSVRQSGNQLRQENAASDS